MQNKDLALERDLPASIRGAGEETTQWTTIISPIHPWFNINLPELWNYWDLIMLFVRRDLVAQYKQTVLGPLWYFIQPLFTSIVFTVVFGKIAKIPTDGIPDFLFYLSGNVVWAYFSSCLVSTSTTFSANAGIFGKVYFPRLTVPISIVISKAAQFAIQFLLFLVFYGYFALHGASLEARIWILTLPLMILQMALLGLGVGILISSLTTKYRDLNFVMAFAVQLWMYATPIVYPLSQIPERFRLIYNLNPMAAVVESFRYAFLGEGTVEPMYLVLSWSMTLLILFAGIVLFTRIEKTFMDTV